MSFLDTIRRAKAYLEEQGRVSLSALEIEFDLDDTRLESLIEELVDVQQVAAREGKVLAWIGGPQGSDAPRSTTPEAPQPAAEAERRQLTVLFCDLVDSTSLAAGLDPEDWREVVRGYQEAAAAAVERFAGHVAQYLGDGLLVYFGWPKAHEDDAERAVRAGLAIVDAISVGDARLAVRIGIHTGPVVVGEMGGGASRETLAMGDTTNVAARLQGVTEPDAVVMSGATLRLTPGVFVTEDLGEQELKGLAQPVRAHRAVQAAGVRSHLDVLAAAELTPFVGRDQELGLLDDRFAQVVEGRGQVVLICGEAGIGKSRLMHAFRERLAERPHSWLECRGSPYTQDSALYPVLEVLRQGLGFRPEDVPESKLEALETGLANMQFDLDEAVPLLAALHSVPLGERYATPNLSPEGMRKKTLALLTEWVLRLGQRQPLVVLMEDLHWMDPSTVELLGQIIEQVPTAGVLLLATYRPDFEPPLGARSHVTPMLLSRFTQSQLGDLVRKSARGRELPEAWVTEILRRSDGVPLFAEELTRAVIETHPEPPEGGATPELRIPDTLQDSLMARLDQLGPVKQLAQLGAVLGREFSYDLLLKVSPMTEAELMPALQAAVREELFYQRGAPPGATYLFKHALIRDAAYQSLLRSTRQRHHARVAETLVERMPEVAGAQPELVAQHLTEAGQAEPAIDWWQRAGHRALDQSANREAARHFRRGIELAEGLSDREAQERLELPLQTGLGNTLFALSDWTQYESTWRRGLDLAERLEDGACKAMALYGLGVAHFTLSQIPECFQFGNALHDHTVASEDLEGELAAWSMLVSCPLLQGQLAPALDALTGFIDRDRLLKTDTSWKRFGASHRVQPRAWGALALWLGGYRDRAVALSEESVALARRTEHPGSLCFALGLRGPMLVTAGLAPDLDRDSRELIVLGEEQSAPLWLGLGRLFQTWVRVAQGGSEDVDVASSQEALALAGSTGNLSGAPALVCCHADTLRRASDAAGALQSIDLALAVSAQLGQPFYDAELQRLRAELLLVRGDQDEDEAERELRKAIDTARSQGAKSFEIRAAVDLARLWQRQGKRDEARDLLQPVYDWFTEGFDTQDLRDAKALLVELGR